MPLPDLTGRTAIVTGANSGIGRGASRALAGAGAHVVLAVRDLEQGRTAAAAMPRETDVRRLDLADLGSVREFASAWDGKIDLLINNVGIMLPPLTRTADGFELQFGTNHLGHFALSNLLPAHIAGRVVTVSSSAHSVGRIDFDDLSWERRPYRAWRAYGQSKLANLLFTSELQRRLSAAVADIPGDSYVGPGGRLMRGAPELVKRSDAARDSDVSRRLWEVSEQLTGVAFPLGVKAAV